MEFINGALYHIPEKICSLVLVFKFNFCILNSSKNKLIQIKKIIQNINLFYTIPNSSFFPLLHHCFESLKQVSGASERMAQLLMKLIFKFAPFQGLGLTFIIVIVTPLGSLSLFVYK